VLRAQVAKGRLRARRPAEGGDRRHEPLGSEEIPGFLALPDVDDPNALVGRAGDVHEQALRCRVDERGRHLCVLVPARRNVLYVGVRHQSSSLAPSCRGLNRKIEEAGLAPV
jgi:hypothetical protein